MRAEEHLHHVIEWEYDRGRIGGRAVCLSPKATCHLKPTKNSLCYCEEYETLQHDADGWFHEVEKWDEEKQAYYLDRHSMEFGEDCNIEEWLNNSDIEELCDVSFKIARTPIHPIWTGDGYEWQPKSAETVSPAARS